MITVDVESDKPLFSQLIVQIKQAVDSGLLNPGEAIPSIRQLAADLGISNKTVAKAYQLLERDEIIQSRGYRGSFVHERARENTQKDISLWLTEEIAKDVLRYRKAGATDSEIRIAFANALLTQTK